MKFYLTELSKITTELHIFEKTTMTRPMLTTSEKRFSFLFSLIVLAELICSSISSLESLHYIFKPAIVVSLLYFFWTHSKGLDKKLRTIIALALLFSLTGDILLMFVSASPHYFLMGLIAFLIAHVLYVLGFIQHRNRANKPFGFIAVLIIYASGLFYILKNDLNDMLVPVILYMVVILTMATAAFLRQGNVPKASYILVFLGALLFMVSDSLLALNKFSIPFAHANIGIMLSYALAQFFIVLGILKYAQALR